MEERDDEEPKQDGSAEGASEPVAGETPDTGAPPDELALEEAPALSAEEVRAVVEALIFASPQPLTPRELGKVLPGIPKETWQGAVEELKADYARSGRGLQLVEVAGGYQITTRPELNEYVRDLLDPRSPGRLSIQALETLAVIAYKQPVTAPEIAEIRGVNAVGVVATLMERQLVRIVGRKQVVGRPFLYGTTREFLDRFGLNDLSDLPKVEDVSELLGFDLPASVAEPAPQTPLPFDATPEGQIH